MPSSQEPPALVTHGHWDTRPVCRPESRILGVTVDLRNKSPQARGGKPSLPPSPASKCNRPGSSSWAWPT